MISKFVYRKALHMLCIMGMIRISGVCFSYNRCWSWNGVVIIPNCDHRKRIYGTFVTEYDYFYMECRSCFTSMPILLNVGMTRRRKVQPVDIFNLTWYESILCYFGVETRPDRKR